MTTPKLGNLGIDWGAIGSGLANMGSSIVSNLAIAFPKIAVSTLTTVVSAKIAEKVAPSSGGGGGGSGGGGGAAPVQQQAAQQQPAQIVQYLPAPSSSVPSWVLPAGVAAGGMVVVAVLYMAFRQKE